MPAIWLLLVISALAVLSFIFGRKRALASVAGDRRRLHSLPNYYGANVALFTFVPAAILLMLWAIAQPMVISNHVAGTIPANLYGDTGALNLLMSDVRRQAEGLDRAVAEGLLTRAEAATLNAETTNIRGLLAQVGVALGSEVSADILAAAQEYRAKTARALMVMTGLVLAVALLGFGLTAARIQAGFRARNVVERFILGLLIGAATLAILTTFGIFFSMLFNTMEFFDLYPAWDFFTGMTWSPSFGGGSQLGIVPLLWGTFYISLIALAVAVPIGLFAAIYLSEYANSKTRSVIKPLLEVLAGIPTIVYGLFALLTVGPLLVRMFGEASGFGWMQGGTAVMTAGLVMGVMLIPFVSSLSDDIINAVPQAMRDGSYAIGATKSETLRQVVLPAALPGIVGAVLLAASRAIGETMIVVLGAGAAARLSLNPFEAMTTMTAKIVSQLTGDADFSSPEALVAFALGMTLFVITLALNVLALYIVRKYREQYE